MKKNTPLIILISLDSGHSRGNALKKQFPSLYSSFVKIKAIDGKNMTASKYFDYMIRTKKAKGKIISPSELGCALSHLSAIEYFISSEHDHCLIIEDDIIGSDSSMIKALETTSSLTGLNMVLCGIQLNRVQNKYLIPNTDFTVKKLSPFQKTFASGAFSYGLTREAALEIREQQSKAIYRADHWTCLAKNIDIHISKLLNHPSSYDNSLINDERNLVHKSAFERVLHDGIFFTLSRNIKKILVSLQTKLLP